MSRSIQWVYLINCPRSVVLSLLEGTCKGVHSLLEEGLTISKEMLSDTQLTYPRTPVLQSLKSKMLDLSFPLYIHCHMTRGMKERNGEDLDPSHLHRVKNTAAKLFQLNKAIGQLHSALSLILRGKVTPASSPAEKLSSRTRPSTRSSTVSPVAPTTSASVCPACRPSWRPGMSSTLPCSPRVTSSTPRDIRRRRQGILVQRKA
nr:uncharacterized protein LOC115109018 isoform X1 [Oncorhynchus nerka]XP_029489419.1 uncharacterized protein LOC115109018 isoform X1 [Oncorhynchus nerka]XP_029489420.1 uncharacterized protein LOC115109018 isoform X1 [Oncorhynchus nerka]